jgi:hypothetical protein
MTNRHALYDRCTREGGPARPRQADQRRRLGELVDVGDEIIQGNAQETV